MFEMRAMMLRLLRLAWPVALARLGIMGMGLVDVMVVGQLAPEELPHQALGWAPTSVLLVTGIGLLTGVQVLAARALGEGEPAHAGGALRRGLVVSAVAGALAVLCMWGLGPGLFTAFGIASELAEPSAAVMRVLALSIPLHLVYITAAFFLEAIQQPLASTTVMWGANAVNLLLNLWWVPTHGAIGSAYATLGARLFLAVVLLGWVFGMKESRRYGTRVASTGPSYSALLKVGAAAALSQAAEASAFSGMTVLAGRIGESAVSAYQIVLNVLAVVFMVALGLSTATSVLVSEATGRGAAREAMRASTAGLSLNTLAMLLACGAVTLFAQPIAFAYTQETSLVVLITALLPITALVMIPDGGQVVAAAALRARGDNWFPTASHIVAYALAMPGLAFWLAEVRGGGVSGLLWAMFCASVLSAGVLIARSTYLGRNV